MGKDIVTKPRHRGEEHKLITVPNVPRMVVIRNENFTGIPPFPVSIDEADDVNKRLKVAAKEALCGLRFPPDSTPLETKTSHTPHILACLAAASFFFPSGFALAFSAVLIPQLQQPFSDIPVTTDDISWIASVFMLAMLVGSLMVGYLVDRLGRLATLKMGVIPYVAAWVLIATAQNLPMLLVGRFFSSIAGVFQTFPALIFISEVGNPNLRGTLSALCTAFAALGTLSIYLLGTLFYWRTMAWLVLPFCLVPFIFSTLWGTESPVWLMSKGKTKEATDALTFLLRQETKTGAAVQRELAVLEENQKKSTRKQHPSRIKFLRDLIKPTGFKPFTLVALLLAFQQFSGICVIIFYAINVFQEAGASISPYLCTVGVGIIHVVFGVVSSFLLREFGRRSILMITYLGMAFFAFAAGYVTREVHLGNLEPNSMPALFILAYMSLGVTGPMTVTWTMTSEMFPLQIRGMAQGISTALGTGCMLAAIKMFPLMTELLGGIYYVLWVYAAVSLTSVVFVFLFLPETHNKTLSQIEDYFKHNTVYVLRQKQKSPEEAVEMA